MSEKTLIVMWISGGTAIIFATYITGNPACLYGFVAPTVITFYNMF